MTIPEQTPAISAIEKENKEVRRQLDFAYGCFALVGFTMLAIAAEPFFVEREKPRGRLWIRRRHAPGPAIGARSCAGHLLDGDAPALPPNRGLLSAQPAASCSRFEERCHGVGLWGCLPTRASLVVRGGQMAQHG